MSEKERIQISLPYKCRKCQLIFLISYSFLGNIKNNEINHACEGESRFFGNNNENIIYICNECAVTYNYPIFQSEEMKNAKLVMCECGGEADYTPAAKINPFGMNKK